MVSTGRNGRAGLAGYGLGSLNNVNGFCGRGVTTGQLGKPPVCLFLDLNKHRNSVKRYTPNW